MTTLADLATLRPADTEVVLDLPGIFRGIIDYLTDSTLSSSGITVQAPVGSIVMFAGSTAPTGWLFCDGSTISNVNYPELWAEIGTTYGGTGATSFYLPNTTRKFPLGAGGTKLFSANTGNGQLVTWEINPTLGSTGGEEKHTLLKTELPAEGIEGITPVSEGIRNPFGDGTTQVRMADKANSNHALGLTPNLGSGISSNNMPPALVFNFIIKAKP